MKIKVLQLETWMRYSNHAQIIRMGYCEIHYPYIGRTGYYLARFTDKKSAPLAWFEKDGKAYLCKRTDDFLYVLSLYNHKPLSANERAAMQLLLDNRRISKSLHDVLCLDKCWRDLREIQRGARLARLQLTR